MKVLIVAYCFGNSGGQALIGVYKRGLRIAFALHERGHDITVHCGGHGNFHDAMTAKAQQLMKYVEWPPAPGESDRDATLRGLVELGPDCVVIGEAPLAGALLEITLCAAELGIPVACVDNAYGPDACRDFAEHFGGMFDGLVLSGPSTFQAAASPPFVKQVPPFAQPERALAERLLREELNVPAGAVMTVLAYDSNVEALGSALFERMGQTELHAVFVTHQVSECRQRLDRLAPALQRQLRVIPPLNDGHHFGLLALSRLVVGKCAFMQVSECLSLLTPVLCYHFKGDFSLDLVPAACHPFVHATSSTRCDDATLAAARRLSSTSKADMLAVHDGSTDAANSVASWLETLRVGPRSQFAAHCEAAELSPARLLRAARALHGDSLVEDDVSARSCLLRSGQHWQHWMVTMQSRVDGRPQVDRLWYRRFRNPESARVALPPDARVLAGGLDEGFFLLEDPGPDALPEL